MDVLQVICFLVCEQIKGALSLCLACRTTGPVPRNGAAQLGDDLQM